MNTVRDRQTGELLRWQGGLLPEQWICRLFGHKPEDGRPVFCAMCLRCKAILTHAAEREGAR